MSTRNTERVDKTINQNASVHCDNDLLDIFTQQVSIMATVL